MFSPTYKGQSFYIDKPSVADNNLITLGAFFTLPPLEVGVMISEIIIIFFS